MSQYLTIQIADTPVLANLQAYRYEHGQNTDGKALG